jgi:signal transduction histidine kinase
LKSYILAIHESASMLNERIETCLDPDKIEFGAEPMQMIAYPLKNAVNNAMPIVQGLAQSANIELIDEVSNNLPCVHADGRALKKIIVNLLTNAIQHSRPRGTVRITAHLTASGDMILIVEDNGVGMDERLLSALENGIRPGPVGEDATLVSTGIGLFVVKHLVDLHQGTLALKTSEASGTTATITFPANRVLLKSRP